MKNTTLQVANINQSIDFYTRVLGMRVLEKNDYPLIRCTIARLVSHNIDDDESITLTQSWSGTKASPIRFNASVKLKVNSFDQAISQSKYHRAEILKNSLLADNVALQIKDPDGYSVSLFNSY